MNREHTHPARGPARSGFSMIETAIALAIAGGLLVASISVVGSVSMMRRSATEMQTARLLADDLMAEVLAASYEEPDGATSLGIDTGESGSDRTTFDDVDDYTGWISSPPRGRAGTPLTADTSWRREVSVRWAPSDNLDGSSASESNVKRITVQVRRNNRLLISQTAIRTRAWGGGG